MSPNLAAFLRVIREGESNQTDDAYTLINGGGHFASFDDHPYAGQSAPPGKAAGAYQDIPHTWQRILRLIGPGDFSPARQDAGNAALIKALGALPAVEAGDLPEAIRILSDTWVSLPGLGLERARRVFKQYGGVELPATQPAAPIEERSTEVPQKDPIMGGLLGNLLMSVVGSFLNPTTAQNVTSIVQKDGQQSTAAQSLFNTLLNAVATAAGTTPAAMQADPKVAIAATAAVQADAAKLQAVEDAANAHLQAVMPFVQQLAILDQMRYDAEIRGKQTVSTIAIEEHKAGLWDMTPTLVLTVAVLMGIISTGLLAAIIWQATTGDHLIDSGLIGLAGPIWMGAVVSTFTAMIAYRFDGTKDSHAAAEAQQATAQYRAETDRSKA